MTVSTSNRVEPSNQISATANAELPAANADAHLQYRALSSAAMISLVLGIASALIIPTAMASLEGSILLCPLPIVGLFVGWRALVSFRRAPDQFTGRPLAQIGMALSLFFLIGGIGLGSYVYATEVPEGYTRLTFAQFKPDESERGRRVNVPPEAAAHDGQQVFLKGFMRPSKQKFGLSTFLLVRDNNECCFGENVPEYYDRVQVQFVEGLHTDYSPRIFRMAGTLKIAPDQAYPGTQATVYTLIADYVK